MPVPASGPAPGRLADRSAGRRRLTRRGLLAACVAGAATLAGCTSDAPDRPRTGPSASGGGTSGRAVAQVDPDVAVAVEALTAQRAAVDLLTATVQRHPRLAPALTATREVHEAHVALLEDAVPAELRPSPTASNSPSPTATASPGGASPGAPDRRTRVPRRRGRALAEVVAAEQALATTTKQQAFSAQSGAFARVLGSMAAAAAQQATVLARSATRSGGAA